MSKKTEPSPNRQRREIKRFLLSMILIFGGILTYTQVSKYETKIKLQDIDIKDRSEQIQQLETKFNKANEQINQTLQQKDLDTQKLQQLEQERENLRKQLEDTQKALQAKVNAKQKSTIALSGNASAGAPTQSTAPSGTCMDWIKQAGVPEAEIQAAYWLLMKESSCKVNIINKSSGACGLAQALPCSKMAAAGHIWNDPISAIQWQIKYVRNRYGTYNNAKAFHLSHNWY